MEAVTACEAGGERNPVIIRLHLGGSAATSTGPVQSVGSQQAGSTNTGFSLAGPFTH